jgi:hypothetical protein
MMMMIIIIIRWFLWLLGKGKEVRFRGMCCGFVRDLPGRTEKSHRFLVELPVIRSENVKFPNIPLLYTTHTGRYKRKHLADTTSVKVKLFHNKSGNHRGGWNFGHPSLT